ncbi:hypothetical protein FJW06_13030 [Mesorhizobium sp. B4-1-3]|uniref:hypothetical protein n=1 Tax=Mesorhizobium sp. B4-1-3 TaxID=2589889 RepID=UPI0011298613|nr:hypothetical protein [Mesorhizobium sp. B4-1-3]TPI13644.1 hypothetical protein FJW06_13030 [Mesorhizobium sp. B4-1-3]
MVYDLRSGYPAQMPDMVLLGLTQEEAEELAGQANELLSAPRPAMLSGYFSFLPMFCWPLPEQSTLFRLLCVSRMCAAVPGRTHDQNQDSGCFGGCS